MAEKKAPPKKPKAASRANKKGSVIGAVEDIQRMSEEAIGQEIDRMVEHTQRHFKIEHNMPCTGVAAKLQRCLSQHREESYQCFNIMDEYQQCVILATQDHVDLLAEQDEKLQPVEPLQVWPPQAMPQPAVTVKERSSRSWFKPWTWLR